MNKFTPRKWAARRKMGMRPRRLMRRDQAQSGLAAKQQARRQARRQARKQSGGGTTLAAAAQTLGSGGTATPLAPQISTTPAPITPILVG